MLTGMVEDKVLVLMINSADCLADGLGQLTVDHFQDRLNKDVFCVLKRFNEAGREVSIITIAEDCRKLPGFDLMRFMNSTLSSKSEFAYLLGRLEDMRQGREVYKLLQDGIDRLQDEETAIVIDSLMEGLFRTGEKTLSEEIISGKELSTRALSHIDARVNRKKSGVGLYTQWPKLNRMIGAFEPGDLVIVSAPTGSGKSAFCQNIFKYLSVGVKVPGLYINSEMSEEQMSLRWAAMLSDGVTHSQLRAGELQSAEYDALITGMDRLYTSKFACVTIPDLSIDRVSSIVRRYKKSNGVQCVAVDYIGRMDTMNAKLREDQVLLNAAKRLKTLAQQTNVVMFMVAQVRKDGALQSASYMENEADLHLSLEPMSDEEAERMAANMKPWNYRLHIRKGRNCQKGWTFMKFQGEKLTFYGEE
jgi:replicative DNA helicase